MPGVWAPRTSNGYGWDSAGSAALSSASSPTCGPLPWVTTSSCSCASGDSATTAAWAWRSCTWAPGRSPRASKAFPPNAATTRTASVPQGGDHDRLDGVQAVLGTDGVVDAV